jgi:adenylylsulfate kinase
MNKGKILLFGLPGSGKSTLAEQLAKLLNGVWLNADEIRKEYNDWDFSMEGRIRQANRMRWSC